jgi:hypothetical protein
MGGADCKLHGRAAEQRDEIAPFHCSMPSRASGRKDSTPQYGRSVTVVTRRAIVARLRGQ